MIDLKEDSPLEMLRQYAVYFNADLIEDFGAARLLLDNDEGKGSISLYEIFSGLTAWTYDIKFSADVVIDMTFSGTRSYYFGYNVSGYQLQKFPHEEEYQKIQQGQNFILISGSGTKANFLIPKEVQYKCCYLIINPTLLKNSAVDSNRRLELDLKETFDNAPKKEIYRYFGTIDSKTGAYAEVVVQNNKTNLAGRLLTEGAIINMLSSQIASHDEDKNSEDVVHTLSNSELSLITGLGDYIMDNLSEKLTVDKISKHLSLSPKKIQAGLRFLYGVSANTYFTNFRLEHARELIHTTDKNISEICYSVGYQSRSYFSLIFEKRYGILPNMYRKSFKKDNLLFEISYRSVASDDISNEDIHKMISAARKKNLKLGVTGSLIYHQNTFFHMLEGTKKEILRLFEDIKKDQRHTEVKVMWKGFKVKRDFDNLAMATITDADLKLVNFIDTIDNTLTLENLWRKVRNIIKTSDKV